MPSTVFYRRALAALCLLAASCSRQVPERYPSSSAASPEAKPAKAASVTRAFEEDVAGGEQTASEQAQPSASGHEGHHGHHH